MKKSVVFTFPYQTNLNHSTEAPTVGYLISERHWKSTFSFTEILNIYSLKPGTLCQIVKFASQFSLKLYLQFRKHFRSMFLEGVDRIFGQHL